MHIFYSPCFFVSTLNYFCVYIENTFLLKGLQHEHLCQYIDIQRGASNPDRLFVISEHYSLNLNDLLNDTYLYNLIGMNTLLAY